MELPLVTEISHCRTSIGYPTYHIANEFRSTLKPSSLASCPASDAGFDMQISVAIEIAAIVEAHPAPRHCDG
jgi:hypothetical protein